MKVPLPLELRGGKMCPTLKRLLECEARAWYGKGQSPKKWDVYSQALADLIHSEDFEGLLIDWDDKEESEWTT